MSRPYKGKQQARHTDEIQDIITRVPSGLLRWSGTLFFGIFLLLTGLAAFIRYPDIVKAPLKVVSPDRPRAIVAKIPSKLIKLIAKNNQIVNAGQALAYLESTAKHKFTLHASEAGRLTYAGIARENKMIASGQPVFYITTVDDQYFGEMAISQNDVRKVKEGQEVLVKVTSYPFEEYGLIRGHISHISDTPLNNGVFMSRVNFVLKNSIDLKKSIHLKQGMTADAEIITQDATILQRICSNFIKK